MVRGKILKILIGALFLCNISLAGCAQTVSQNNIHVAEQVYKNASVYTANSKHDTAEAVAVKDGKIVFVGSNKDVESWISKDTKVTDLQGKMLMPSFFEAHAHSNQMVEIVYGANILPGKSVEEYVKTIKEYVKAHPDYQVYFGGGWNNDLFPNSGPSKEDLDAISKDKPIVIRSWDHHSAWVNSKALEMAKFTKDTSDPLNGKIERNASGEPSGTVRESAADKLEKAVPDHTVEQYKDSLLAYQKMALSLGFGGSYNPLLDVGSNAIEAFKQLAKEGQLKMRFRGAYYIDPAEGLDQLKPIIDSKDKDSVGDMFKMTGVKIFADGVVDSRTAYLLEPYDLGAKEAAGYKGRENWKPEAFKEMAVAANKAGFQLHIHAIGDGAVKDSLDAIAYSQEKNGKQDYRNAITHIQLMDPADADRFKQLNVIAATNPIWAETDNYYYNTELPFLGKKRADNEYPEQSFFKKGVVVTTASDFPVTNPPNPLTAIEIGVTRSTPDILLGIATDNNDPKFKKPLTPEEAASVEDMIASTTINVAYENRLESETGSIEVGKSADMVVLDKNLLKIAPSEISKAKVLQTIFQGKEVFRDNSFEK